MGIEQKRAEVRAYVLSMLSVFPGDGLFTTVVQSALEHNILDENAEISDSLVLTWYSALFEKVAAIDVTV